ncbi:MAG: hypothetical protein HY293_23095, partial [Planctomycetes bacterium]|nr:hypothetical protein [Planctomycetota bacterium]
RALRFPDDRAFCLVCGAPPAGARRVWFEDVPAGNPGSDLAHLGSQGHALGKGIAAIRDRVQFDAPLCGAPLRRASRTGWAALGLMLLAVGVLVAAILMLKQFKVPKKQAGWVDWLPFIPALVPAVFGGLLWKRKDRGGLPCDVYAVGDEVLLVYPDRVPGKPAS